MVIIMSDLFSKNPIFLKVRLVPLSQKYLHNIFLDITLLSSIQFAPQGTDRQYVHQNAGTNDQDKVVNNI